jgi:hypothetical protein
MCRFDVGKTLQTGKSTWTVGFADQYDKWCPVSSHPTEMAAQAEADQSNQSVARFDADRINQQVENILRAARPSESERDYGSPFGWGLL